MAFRLAAELTVVAHLIFVAFLLGGGFLAWRRRELLVLHVPAVALSLTLAVAGLNCPLTDLEKWLRIQAGVVPYRDGFVSHYLVEPIHAGGVTPMLEIGLRLFTVAVIATAYLGLLARRIREDRMLSHGSNSS